MYNCKDRINNSLDLDSIAYVKCRYVVVRRLGKLFVRMQEK